MASSYHAPDHGSAVEVTRPAQYPRSMLRRRKPSSRPTGDPDREALFEKLAQRPESVCPFLGLADQRAEYQAEATDDHRCYAFGDPEPVSGDQQRNVCLQLGYANCPRYLRGVLVIPSDELEALRRPPQRVPPPPTEPRTPAPSGGGRRRWAVVLVLVLLVGGGAGTWWFLSGREPVAVEPTPTPSASESPAASPSHPEPSEVATPSPDPTPEPGDVFIGYEVTVLSGTNDVFRVDDAGAITGQSHASFSRFSRAPVDRVVATNGLLHWKVTAGELTGWSFIRDQSGPFLIREVYQGSDGTLRYSILPEDEV